MNLEFSTEQLLFRDSVRAYLDRNIDREVMHGMARGEVSETTFRRGLAELGCFAVSIPEALQGFGLGFFDLALTLEEFGAALVPPLLTQTMLAGDVIARYGTAQQRAELLPKLAAGELTIALAVAEPHPRFDPENLSTVVTYGARTTVRGTKILVPEIARADLLLVAVRSPSEGATGLLLVKPTRSDVTVRSASALDKLSAFHEISFANMLCAPDDVLDGFASSEAFSYLLNVGTVAAALQQVGIAARVLDMSVKYANGRIQFGRPIGSFQSIKHKCSDVAVLVEAGRAAAYFAAGSVGAALAEARRCASIAKAFCGRTASIACNEAIQVHGGIGFTWELGLHYYLRRAKSLEHSFGNCAYHQQYVALSRATSVAAGFGRGPARE